MMDNKRRAALIAKNVRDTITPNEQIELQRLQDEAAEMVAQLPHQPIDIGPQLEAIEQRLGKSI